MAIAILVSLALFLPASVVSGASQEDVRASTSTFKSLGADDGWILESGESTNAGGTMLNSSTTLRLGDDVLRKQYISILSFNTASLPDNAIVTKVTFKIQRQSVVGGINPVTAFQGFMVDVRKGTFGLRSLQLSDWKATANMTLGPFTIGTTGGWYVMNLTDAQDFVNKRTTGSGLTQIRLRFQVNDNNNSIANIFNFYSGNAASTKRPQLIVQYNVP
jgi:hypothetical protein